LEIKKDGQCDINDIFRKQIQHIVHDVFGGIRLQGGDPIEPPYKEEKGENTGGNSGMHKLEPYQGEKGEKGNEAKGGCPSWIDIPRFAKIACEQHGRVQDENQEKSGPILLYDLRESRGLGPLGIQKKDTQGKEHDGGTYKPVAVPVWSYVSYRLEMRYHPYVKRSLYHLDDQFEPKELV
jgi:hypothetical protein